MDDFEQNLSCGMDEVGELDQDEAVSENVLKQVLEELTKKAEDKKDAMDVLLEGDAKKLAPKLAKGELSKEEEDKLRAVIKDAFTAGKIDNFVKYLNAELKASKSNFEFVVPKQDDVFFTLKVKMMNKTMEKEAWSLDVLVAELPRSR